MKWMLVVLIGGMTPVQTDVIFEKLSDCLAAEEQLRKAYTDALMAWDKQAAMTFERRRDYVRARELQARKLDNSGTVYPTQGAASQLPHRRCPISLPPPRQRRRQLTRRDSIPIGGGSERRLLELREAGMPVALTALRRAQRIVVCRWTDSNSLRLTISGPTHAFMPQR